MRSHKNLWELVGTQEQFRLCYRDGVECSWVLTVLMHNAHESLSIGTHECSWPLISAYEGSWMLMSSHQQPWAWRHEHSWPLMSSQEQFSVLMGNHEKNMAQWALLSSNGHLRALIAQWQRLQSAHNCSWALMSAYDCSLVIMTVQALDQKYLPVVICNLQIS